MLVQESGERNDGKDIRLACSLAAVAGGLNASAFHAVGFFSANMTGNVSALSDHLALGDAWAVVFLLAILLLFVSGAGLASFLVQVGRRRRLKATFAGVIVLEGLLLLMLGVMEAWGPDAYRRSVLVLGLSFAMGLQNAVVTRISDARVRTTHVSGMATDIGIALGTIVDEVLRRRSGGIDVSLMSRLRLHACTIAAFLAGGVVGVALHRVVDGKLIFGFAGALLAIGTSGLAKATRQSRTDTVP